MHTYRAWTNKEGHALGRTQQMVSVLGLKLDHDQNEFLFNLDEKFQNYDANAVRITRRAVSYTHLTLPTILRV